MHDVTITNMEATIYCYTPWEYIIYSKKVLYAYIRYILYENGFAPRNAAVDIF